MQAIGIDIGSSSIKGAVLDLDCGTLRHIEQIPFCEPAPGLPALHVEISPTEIVSRVSLVLRNLLAHAAADCDALYFCTQMGGLILTDAHGSAISNYLSWRDQRNTADGFQEKLRARLTEGLLRNLGNEFRPGGTINLLAWLANHQRLPTGPLIAMGLGDFVVSNLCESAPAAHPTAALGTLDLTRLDWCTEALDGLGIRNVRWPNLVDLRQPVGQIAIDGRHLDCYAAVGDHQCALAGAGLQERELSINVSTGSQVSERTASLRLGAGYQSRPFFDGSWLNTVTHLPAGRALNVLVDLLTALNPAPTATPEIWSRIVSAVGATPDTDLDVALSFFAGPAGDRGHIANIGIDNLTVGHLFRAAIKNMAVNYQNAARTIADGGKGNWDRIVFSGGLTRKFKSLPPLIAAKFGLPFRIAAATEETLQGLLALARRRC